MFEFALCYKSNKESHYTSIWYHHNHYFDQLTHVYMRLCFWFCTVNVCVCVCVCSNLLASLQQHLALCLKHPRKTTSNSAFSIQLLGYHMYYFHRIVAMTYFKLIKVIPFNSNSFYVYITTLKNYNNFKEKFSIHL